VRGAEGSLHNFREIIDGVLVEDELANLPAWELLLRSNMGEIEYIDLLLLPELICLLGSHCLDLDRPLGIFALLDGFV
jgi:hypothetical protein